MFRSVIARTGIRNALRPLTGVASLHTLRTRVVTPSNLNFARRFEHNQKSLPEEDKRAKRIALHGDWAAPVLTYEEIKPLTEQPSMDRYIIDVREPDEVAQGMIPSAVSLPLSALPKALHMQSALFRDEYGYDKPKRAQEVIFYCRSGKRSASASDIAKRNGYENVKNYEGSWLDWTKREGKGDGGPPSP